MTFDEFVAALEELGYTVNSVSTARNAAPDYAIRECEKGDRAHRWLPADHDPEVLQFELELAEEDICEHPPRWPRRS